MLRLELLVDSHSFEDTPHRNVFRNISFTAQRFLSHLAAKAGLDGFIVTKLKKGVFRDERSLPVEHFMEDPDDM
jgi:hypothetical protein